VSIAPEERVVMRVVVTDRDLRRYLFAPHVLDRLRERP
jgi:hypothetical protein